MKYIYRRSISISRLAIFVSYQQCSMFETYAAGSLLYRTKFSHFRHHSWPTSYAGLGAPSINCQVSFVLLFPMKKSSSAASMPILFVSQLFFCKRSLRLLLLCLIYLLVSYFCAEKIFICSMPHIFFNMSNCL